MRNYIKRTSVVADKSVELCPHVGRNLGRRVECDDEQQVSDSP